MYQVPFQRRNEYPTLGDLVTSGYQVFDGSWDTYIPEYKQQLISKIVRHYFFYEIAGETPDRFKFYINQTLAEIMPYYNQLYQSELIKFNPMVNHSLKTNGRSIENLIRVANNEDNELAKSIRNFAETGSQYGTGREEANSTADSTLDKTGESWYTKDGTEHLVGNKVEDGVSHSVADRDVDSKTTTKTDETVTTNEKQAQSGSDKTIGDTDVVSKETTTPNLTETTSGSKNVNGTTNETTSGTSSDTTTTNGTTGEKTHLDENTTEAQEKDYSDTPQKKLGTPEEIRKDYLTNVTWTDTDTNHTADGTKDTEYEETKKSDGETSGTRNVTDNNDTEYNETKQNTGTNVKDGNTTTDSTSTTEYGKVVDTDGTKVTDGTDVEDGHTDDVTTTDANNTVTTNTKEDKEWTENGHDNSIENSVGKDVKNSTLDSTNRIDSANNRRDDSVNDRAKTSHENEQSTTDKGTSDIAEGFMNVSPASLLKAFRETFINIDEMIIERLRENFVNIF